MRQGFLWLVVLMASACGAPGATNALLQPPGTRAGGRSTGTYSLVDAGMDLPDGYVDGAPLPDGSEPPWVYQPNYSFVVMTPDGKHVLAGVPVPGPGLGFVQPGLELVAYDLDAHVQKALGVMDVERINFSPDGKTAWLLDQGGLSLARMNVDTLAVEAEVPLPQRFSVLDVSPDGGTILASNRPLDRFSMNLASSGSCNSWWNKNDRGFDINRCSMVRIDAATGAVTPWDNPLPIRDIDWSPFRSEIIVTSWQWPPGQPEPATDLAFLTPTSTVAVANVPVVNCGDDLVIAQDFGIALLAPSFCKKDPVSVVDLDKRAFVKNLPGFGPVSLLGHYALGFTAKADMATRKVAQKFPYGLVRIDLETLQWTTMEWGWTAPSYAPVPDGKHALVWAYSGVPAMQRLDIDTLELVPLKDPYLRLDRFVWSPDGKAAVALSAGHLVSIDVATPSVVDRGPANAQNLQKRPGGAELILGKANRPLFFERPWDADAVASSFELDLGALLAPDVPVQPGWAGIEIADGDGVTPPTCGQDGAAIDAVSVWQNLGSAAKMVGAPDLKWLDPQANTCPDFPFDQKGASEQLKAVGSTPDKQSAALHGWRLNMTVNCPSCPMGCRPIQSGDSIRVQVTSPPNQPYRVFLQPSPMSLFGKPNAPLFLGTFSTPVAEVVVP